MRFSYQKAKYHRYFLGLQELEIVKTFKYLGVDLLQNLTWTATKWRFAMKAKSRAPLMLKARLEGLSVSTGVKLWESMIRPTLEYGAEVWGGGKWPLAEKFQNSAGKTLLGLYKTFFFPALSLTQVGPFL